MVSTCYLRSEQRTWEHFKLRVWAVLRQSLRAVHRHTLQREAVKEVDSAYSAAH